MSNFEGMGVPSVTIDKLKEATAGYSTEVLKLATSQVTLSTAQATAIFEAKGLTGAELEQAVATATLSTSQEKATASTKNLGLEWKGLASKLGLSVTQLNITAGALAAVAVGMTVYKQYKQHLEELSASGNEAASAFENASSSVADYTDKYKELRTALINAKGNEEETYNIKKQLLDLQTELNDKFGEEYGKLNLVTDAYKDQTEVIKAYNAEAAKTFLNENEEEIRTATKLMTDEKHYNLSYTGNSAFTDEGKALKEVAEQFKDSGIMLLDELGTGDYSQFSVHLTADVQSAYETINAFESALREKAEELGNEHMFDDVLEISSAELNRSKSIIDDWGQIYKQSLLSEIVSSDSLSSEYNKAVNAVQNYNDAVLQSEDPYNDANVKSAYDSLQTIKSGIQENEEEWGKYSAVTDKVFDEALTGSYEFYNDIKANSQNLIDDITGLTDTELLSMSNDGQEDSFDKLCASAEKYGLSIQDVIDLLVHLGITQKALQESSPDITPTLSITDTIDQLNTQLKPAFDSLKSAYQDIFTDDGFTLENVDISMLDSIKSSIDSLNEMDGIEIDYSSFENLAKVLTDTSSASDDVQTSINTLATEIVNSLNPALKDVTGESYQLVQQMLESLGVQNAEQVMISSLGYTYSEYTAAKQECANAGFDLANATEEEIANFIVEQGGAENCGEALALLQLKKLLLNTTRIDQTSDINNILTLAGAAGVASESMVRLANAKLLLDNAVANNDSRGIAVAKQELIDAGQAAKDSVLDFKPVELDFSPASSSKSKGSGSKSEKDTYLESYKKERAELEHLHNMELITDKEFYDRLRDLNEKYFNDTAEHHEKYLDEYQSNEEKIFKGLKQVYQDSLEEHKSMMDSAASHAQRVLDKEIDKLKSDSKTTIKHYEQRIDAIDKEIDAKQGIIDKYQDELDAMELANQKRKDAISLQKAQYELDRAQNQRTIGQYQNGQKIYLTDGKAVRDAEDDRDEAEYNIKRTEIQEKISLVQKEIDALEAKQDRLQAKIDQENQALDAQIEKLEAYKERWAEIAEKQTIAQEEAAFLAICGAEGEAEILAMREGILQGFSDNYDAITTNLADLAQANADRMAEIANQMESAASRAAKAASDMARAQASLSSPKGEKYASGTKSAKRGLNLVAEEKPEAIIDNEGVRLITKPTLLQMSGGEQVLNGEETATLLDGDTSLSPRIKELLSRSQIESIGSFANMNVMPSFQHNVKLPSFDFSKLQVREQPQNIEVNIGDIKLDNVKDSHSLARDIVNRMPSYVIQEINKR